MWTTDNRKRCDRNRPRYPSDLTDEEWAHVAPLIPPAKRGGNRRHVKVREVVNGIMKVLSVGCQWRAIPRNLPPRSTLFDYLDPWSWETRFSRAMLVGLASYLRLVLPSNAEASSIFPLASLSACRSHFPLRETTRKNP
jgi:transposase